MLESIRLSADSPVPLYRQLYAQLAAGIKAGEIPAGTRLPSTRDVAERLGVTRMTVMTAYADLEADGLVRGGVGRGTFVLGPDGVSHPLGMRRPA